MDDIRHKLQTKPTRFLDQLRLHIRQQGLAYKTEESGVRLILPQFPGLRLLVQEMHLRVSFCTSYA